MQVLGEKKLHIIGKFNKILFIFPNVDNIYYIFLILILIGYCLLYDLWTAKYFTSTIANKHFT